MSSRTPAFLRGAGAGVPPVPMLPSGIARTQSSQHPGPSSQVNARVAPSARPALYAMHRASRSLVDVSADARRAAVVRAVQDGEAMAEERRRSAFIPQPQGSPTLAEVARALVLARATEAGATLGDANTNVRGRGADAEGGSGIGHVLGDPRLGARAAAAGEKRESAGAKPATEEPGPALKTDDAIYNLGSGKTTSTLISLVLSSADAASQEAMGNTPSASIFAQGVTLNLVGDSIHHHGTGQVELNKRTSMAPPYDALAYPLRRRRSLPSFTAPDAAPPPYPALEMEGLAGAPSGSLWSTRADTSHDANRDWDDEHHDPHDVLGAANTHPDAHLVGRPAATSAFHSSHAAPIAPRDDEGHEVLPPYSNAVYLRAEMPRKAEFTAPGVPAKDRKWRRVVVVLEGTVLRIYRVHAGGSTAARLGAWWENTVGAGDRNANAPTKTAAYAHGGAGVIRLDASSRRLSGEGRVARPDVDPLSQAARAAEREQEARADVEREAARARKR